MQRLPSEFVDDPRYTVPAAPPAQRGLAWLRTAVVRFSEGDEHARRRAMTDAVIDALTDAPFLGTPTRSLLSALGLPPDLEQDVALVSGAYQPHTAQSPAADAAADRLVAACGGRTEHAAAQVCVLVQAHAATLSLAGLLRTGSNAPPVPATRRVAPDGQTVEIALDDAPFGRGTHRCPGEALARRLAAESLDNVTS